MSNLFLDGLRTDRMVPNAIIKQEDTDDFQMEGGEEEVKKDNKLPPINFKRNMQAAAVDF